MSENERQQRLIERVQEDERLRGDLPDAAATALVEWATKLVSAAAAEPTRPDAEVEAEAQAIRAAARAAARSGEGDSQRLLALAEGELAKHSPPAAQPGAAASIARPAPPSPTSLAAAVGAGAAQSQPPASPPPSSEQPQRGQKRRWSPFSSLLRRMRGGR